MLKQPKISLVLTCYNEMEHLERSLLKISGFLGFVFPDKNYEIILVDDGSTDGTRDELKKYSYFPFHVHLNEKNQGRGGAVKRGLKLARGSIIGFMDIDCEVSEAYLPRFIQAIDQGADMAIGSRIYSLAPHPYVLLRHFLSVVYKWILKRLIRSGIEDSEVGFKFFSRDFATQILNKSQFEDWFWDTEVSLLAEHWGMKIMQIPVAFKRSEEKTSTVKVFRDSWRYLKALIRYIRLQKKGVYD